MIKQKKKAATAKKSKPATAKKSKPATAKKAFATLSSKEAMKNPEAIFKELGRVNTLLSEKVLGLSQGRALLIAEIKKSLKKPENYSLTAAPFNEDALTEVMDACLLLAKMDKTQDKWSAAESKQYQFVTKQVSGALSGAFVDGDFFYKTLEQVAKNPKEVTRDAFTALKQLCDYYWILEVLAHHWSHFLVDAEHLDECFKRA